MPYKRPYKTTAKGRRVRGSAMSRYKKPSKALKQTIQKTINRNIETKSNFSEIDEIAVGQNSSTTLTPFNLISHGNAGNQRIGQKLDPLSVNLKMWFRPRGLVNNGGNANDPGAQYDSAFYSRIILVRQKKGVKYLAGTPVPIATTNPVFFEKNGGTTGALTNDFKDLFYKINPNLAQVVYDRKFYVPMQYKMNNTKIINYTYRFPKSVKQTFSDNSEYPDQPFVMFIINRYADDDAHTTEKTIEYTGQATFTYKDA